MKRIFPENTEDPGEQAELEQRQHEERAYRRLRLEDLAAPIMAGLLVRGYRGAPVPLMQEAFIIAKQLQADSDRFVDSTY